METQSGIRKVIPFVIGLLVFVILAQLLWSYLHTGKVIITTNDSRNTISLTKVGDSDGDSDDMASKVLKTSRGKLSVSVGLGQYTASVAGNSKASIQLIKLGSHKTLKYEIDPINTVAPEPVASQNTQNIAAGGSQLIYLDSSSYTLNKIDANNNLSTPDPSYKFQTVKWVDASYGVGRDINQNLYVIDNNTISPLTLPFSYGSGSVVNFEVAPSRQIYIYSGADIYMGTSGGNFKKMYTVPSTNFVLGATTNKIAVAYKSGTKGDSDSSQLTIVDSSGKLIKKGVDGEVGSLVWSPNGQYLASVNESSITVYDSSLNQVATLPVNFRVGSLVWLNNDKLFFNSVFTLSGQLWSYDLAKQRADLAAETQLDNSITNLAVSSDESYVYITTAGSINDNGQAILRVGLRGQQVPVLLYQLQDLLPMSLSDYSMSLVNFAQPPVILVQPFLNTGSSPQTDLQEAQTQLQQDGFDINKLQFKLLPGS